MTHMEFATETADDQIARIIGELEDTDQLDDTLVVLTADHGEHLGDQHLLDHQYSVAHALVRVPLVVRLPGRVPKGRESGPVTSFDLFPTVLELAGVSAPKAGSGSARSLLRPDEDRPRMADYSKVFENPLKSVRKKDPERDVSRFERGLVSLVLGRWKLVQEIGGSARLYDLSSDPGEERDVSAEHPDEVAKLKKALGQWLATLEPIGGDQARLERSAELKAMLESLGY